MFLDTERTRVKLYAKDCPVRDCSSQGATDRERQQLSDKISDADRRVTEEKELVQPFDVTEISESFENILKR
jgi:uncharacterized Zn finger protein